MTGRFLLDTHVLIRLAEQRSAALPPFIRTVLVSGDGLFVSSASLWEINIKYALGKLALPLKPAELVTFFKELGALPLPVDHRHATTALDSVPPTKDPFDRMLLAQCQVEGLKLLTIDEKLADHPLAVRP